MCVRLESIEEKVSNNHFFICVLKELGVDDKYIGFYYTVDILDLTINRGVTSKSYSKDVYPLVAEKFDRTDCTIERNIRNMIDNCWDGVNKNLKMFWRGDEKPSCCKFIDMVRNYILIKLN